MRGLRSVLNAYIALFLVRVSRRSGTHAASILVCAALALCGCGHKGPLVAPERADVSNDSITVSQFDIDASVNAK